MLGFSFSKIAVLIGIVVAIWYGFKLVGRLDQARKQQKRGGNPTARASGGAPEVEDTVQCPVCKAYVVAKSAGPCDRPDCPY
ncbi:MAG: hypothetical protein JSU82_04400 [Rhodospirillales bacterium]|nr:MAG: hypothetical protein JSU82_04400 [Rhodospirillales bacterium]